MPMSEKETRRLLREQKKMELVIMENEDKIIEYKESMDALEDSIERCHLRIKEIDDLLNG